jgi:hypothetical protein
MAHNRNLDIAHVLIIKLEGSISIFSDLLVVYLTRIIMARFHPLIEMSLSLFILESIVISILLLVIVAMLLVVVFALSFAVFGLLLLGSIVVTLVIVASLLVNFRIHIYFYDLDVANRLNRNNIFWIC